MIISLHTNKHFNNCITKMYNKELTLQVGNVGTQRNPLVLFMADASTVGNYVTVPLTQGYGALEFASDLNQREHLSFMLVIHRLDGERRLEHFR